MSKDIKKILVIKLGAMGDVLRTTGILPALKEKYKDPEICWLVGEASFELINRNPFIAKVLIFRKDEYAKIRESLLEEEFDLVINLEESLETAKITSSIDSEQIGFLYKDGGIHPSETAKEYWGMSELGPSPENDILKKKNKKTYQQLMKEILELPYEVSRPLFVMTGEDEEFASLFLKENRVTETDKIVGINFGAGTRWPTKKIPLGRVEEIADELNNKYKILVFGGKDEEEDVSILKNKSKNIIVADSLTSGQFAALISKCALLITTDTLALHLAVTVGTEVIALFGPTSASEIELYGSGDKITAPMDCYCCYKKSCNKKPFCMDKFDIPAIIDKWLAKK
ncbi:glycosyltransferase family 9 protein [Elusimicrobiota bacterium]